jgi:S-layer homology domain
VCDRFIFADLPSNYSASSAIQQAYTIGFLSAYSGNLFRPNEAIRRQQVLISLANSLVAVYPNYLRKKTALIFDYFLTSGNQIINVVPGASGEVIDELIAGLKISISPCICSINCLAIANPKPVPGISVCACTPR